MTVTIELPPEIEASLVAQAQALGLELTQYLEHLLLERAPTPTGASLGPAERAAAWRESVKGIPHTPPLSDEAISRESIYGDRA
jgi:hypothetical protein